MTNNAEKKDFKLIIGENLSRNVELYNKYTMLLASIFISALTAIGQHNGNFCFWLKSSIVLFSISLAATLFELSLLIVRDSIAIQAINYSFFKKFPLKKYSSGADCLAMISLVGFFLGMIAINIFIFTL